MNPIKYAILNSNIYIGHWEKGSYNEQLSFCRKKYIIRQSSVILHELRRYANTESAIKLVENLRRLSPIILTPTDKNWWNAAEIVQGIAKRQVWERNKIREFQNDVLIALTAHKHGIALITNNHDDFQLIRSKLKFRLEIWQNR